MSTQKSTNQIKISIIKTRDLTAAELMKIGEGITVEDLDVWQAIVGTGKLSENQLVDIGSKVKDRDLWITILKINNISALRLMQIGKISGRFLWTPIVETGKLSEEQLIEAGHCSKTSATWKAIVNAGKLSPDQLTEIGKTIPDLNVCTAIIETGKLSAGQLVSIGNYSDSPETWKKVAGAIEAGDLSSLTPDELSLLGCGVNTVPVWLKIIATNKLDGGQLAGVGIQLRSMSLFRAVIGTGKLTNLQLIKVGNFANDPTTWELIETTIASREG